MPSWADQQLLQLLMEQSDTLQIQCRHIEHMHEGVWFTKRYFDKMTAVRKIARLSSVNMGKDGRTRNNFDSLKEMFSYT